MVFMVSAVICIGLSISYSVLQFSLQLRHSFVIFLCVQQKSDINDNEFDSSDEEDGPADDTVLSLDWYVWKP